MARVAFVGIAYFLRLMAGLSTNLVLMSIADEERVDQDDLPPHINLPSRGDGKNIESVVEAIWAVEEAVQTVEAKIEAVRAALPKKSSPHSLNLRLDRLDRLLDSPDPLLDTIDLTARIPARW